MVAFTLPGGYGKSITFSSTSFTNGGAVSDILHGILAGHDSYANLFEFPPIPTELRQGDEATPTNSNPPFYHNPDVDLESFINHVLYSDLDLHSNRNADPQVTAPPAHQLPALPASYWMSQEQVAGLAPPESSTEPFEQWFEQWSNLPVGDR